MKDPRLKDRAWRARVGFDNVATIADLLREMPPARRYEKMNRLEKAGYYRRPNE